MADLIEPITVVGYGLAGACVADVLLATGRSIRILDETRPGAASPVGPGQINPLATRRLRPAWRLAEALPRARSFYERVERICGERLFHDVPILRILQDERQAKELEARRNEPEANRYIRDLTVEESEWMRGPLCAPYGAFATELGGWLDVQAFLSAHRRLLENDVRVTWNPPDAEPLLDPLSAGYQSVPGTIVWCEGWRMRLNPLWASIDDNPAKGEWVRVRLEGFPPTSAIVNGACWIQPLPDGTARVGSTYSWADFESGPTVEGTATLLRNLSAIFEGGVEVLSQHAGVRPIVRDTRPVVGRHPSAPRHFILNGFGSKGTLYGPWLAELLRDYILGTEALPGELNVQRFFK